MPGLVQRQEDGTVTTGADLIAADPAKYLVADLGATRLNPDTGEYEEVENEYTVEAPDTSMYTVPTNYPMQQQAISENGYLMASNPGGPFARPYVQELLKVVLSSLAVMGVLLLLKEFKAKTVFEPC